jgi:Cu2+-exporting ATPase
VRIPWVPRKGNYPTLIFLLTLGRFVEMLVRHRSTNVTDALARVQPRLANRLRNVMTADQSDSQSSGLSPTEDVNVSQLAIDDELLVRVGEAIPIDGVISKGQSTIDESFLTGESLPVVHLPGERVMAGTINQERPYISKSPRSAQRQWWSALRGCMSMRTPKRWAH